MSNFDTYESATSLVAEMLDVESTPSTGECSCLRCLIEELAGEYWGVSQAASDLEWRASCGEDIPRRDQVEAKLAADLAWANFALCFDSEAAAMEFWNGWGRD